jgi:hypothetical protein
MSRQWTDEELLDDLRAYMRRPWREVRRTPGQRRREQAEAAAAVAAEAVEAAARLQARNRKRWTEKRPGQLHSIHERLRAGDASQLSVPARRMLGLIARRPDVVTSRRWTTAKASRVTVNADMLRSHFHHWAASIARGAATLKARQAAERAAAELVRQDELAYSTLEAAYRREEREQEHGLPPAVDGSALARLIDRSKALREDARLEALERKELDDVPEGPWIALDDRPPSLRVIDGGSE